MSDKKVAIIQSNYIPWRGYFNIIKNVDAFVLLDDVQYTRRDWRNRNLIKTKNGLKWVTIPVQVKGQYFTKIKDVVVADSDWRKDHWQMLSDAYKDAPFFSNYANVFKTIYLENDEVNLSLINFEFIRVINSILEIPTPIFWSMDFDTPPDKTERLVEICKSLKATEYVSGPAAKDYMNVDLFTRNSIKVCWTDYSNYLEYKQLFPPFANGVTVLDLLFNEGPQANNFLKSKLWE
jgi:hypothetical protein